MVYDQKEKGLIFEVMKSSASCVIGDSENTAESDQTVTFGGVIISTKSEKHRLNGAFLIW